MGWNTAALFVEGREPAAVMRFFPDVFQYTDTEERVTSDTAWSSSPGERLYVAKTGEHCQVWDPDRRFVTRIDKMFESSGTRRLAGTRVLALDFSGKTSTYGFWLYDDAELVRRVHFESGQARDPFGEPLACESDAELPSWGHDEDFLWHVARSLLNLGPDVETEFAVYSVT
jgi:hypothetical protein